MPTHESLCKVELEEDMMPLLGDALGISTHLYYKDHRDRRKFLECHYGSHFSLIPQFLRGEVLAAIGRQMENLLGAYVPPFAFYLRNNLVR